MSDSRSQEPHIVEQIKSVWNDAPVTYTITRVPHGGRHPFRASWKTGEEGSSLGMVHQAASLGEAQRLLMKWHERGGGEPLVWSNPDFDRRVTNARYGRGTLINRHGDKLTIRFDDGSVRDIMAAFITFDEER